MMEYFAGLSSQIGSITTVEFQRSLPIAVALLLVRFVATEAVGQKARSVAKGLRFPLAAGTRVAIRVGCPFLLFVSYKILRQEASRQNVLIALVIGLLALYGLLFEPGEIATSDAGIIQKSLFGIRTCTVKWSGAGVLYGPGAEELVVSRADGVSITYTKYHVGREELLSELLKRDIYVPGVSKSFF